MAEEMAPSPKPDEAQTACSVCARRFKSRGGLRDHLTGVHFVSPRFQCTSCDRHYARRKDLAAHRKRKHDDADSDAEEGRAHLAAAAAGDAGESGAVSDDSREPEAKRARIDDDDDDDDKPAGEHDAPTDGDEPAAATAPSPRRRRNKSGEFACDRCAKTYRLAAQLARHVRNRHGEESVSDFVPPADDDDDDDAAQGLPDDWVAQDHYELKILATRRSRIHKTSATDFGLRFKDIVASDISDAYKKILSVFGSAMTKMIGDNRASDAHGRFVLRSANMEGAAQTRYTRLDNLTAKYLTSLVCDMLNSDQSLSLDEDTFTVNFLITEFENGGTSRWLGSYKKRRFADVTEWAKRKRGIVNVSPNGTDYMCLPRVVGVARYFYERLNKPVNKMTVDEARYWKMLRSDRGYTQITVARDLCMLAGVDENRPCGVNEAHKLQNVLAPDYRLIIYGDDDADKPVYAGSGTGVPIYALCHASHYYWITSPTAFFMKKHFCHACQTGWQHNDTKHRCGRSKCPICKLPSCANEKSVDVLRAAWHNAPACDSCRAGFASDDCYQAHLTDKICEQFVVCDVCRKFVERKKESPEKHGCLKVRCRPCGGLMPPGHLCYMRAPRSLAGREDSGGGGGVDGVDLGETEAQRQRRIDVDGETFDELFSAVPTRAELAAERALAADDTTSGRRVGARKRQPRRAPLDDDGDDSGDEGCESGETANDGGDDGKSDRRRGGYCSRYFVADIESELEGDGVPHRPCLLVLRPLDLSDDVKDSNDADNSPPEYLEFWWDNCIMEFLQTVCNDPAYGNATYLFHNMGGYDGYLVLNAAHRLKIHVEMIYRCGRIIALMLPGAKIRLVDMYMFTPLPLSRLPYAFGFADRVTKGSFPYKLCCRANRDYNGSFPSFEMFDPDSLSTEARKKRRQWYDEQVARYAANPNLKYNLKTEMLHYCRSDVDILYEAARCFDREMRAMFSNMRPFTKLTLPSYCNTAFRSLYMRQDTIALIPPLGYSKRSNQSLTAVAFFEWLSHDMGLRVKHAFTPGGEYKLGPYYIDCVIETTIEGHATRLAIEYLGCYHHGCSICYSDNDYNALSKRSMRDLDFANRRRLNYIREQGFLYYQFRECRVKQARRRNGEMNVFIREFCQRWSPLRPRDALRGGRCNVAKLHHVADKAAGESIVYVDFTSLYPSVMLSVRNQEWPIGHPEVFLTDFPELSNIFGLIRMAILPPRRLLFPTLPCYSNGKVRYALCGQCLRDENYHEFCNHTDSQRTLVGTWASFEVQRSLLCGYQPIQLIEVWHWRPENRSTELFKDFLNCGLARKVEATGFADGIESDEDKRQFIEKYEREQGVKLSIENMQPNPALRQVANFWGFFGKNNLCSSLEYVTDQARIAHLLTDDKLEITDIYMPTDDTVVVRHKPKAEFEQVCPKSNVVLAAMTTAYGRLELLNLLETLGERVLYYDTDSCIFVRQAGVPDVTIGSYVGDLTDETTDKFGNDAEITSFTGMGCKAYTYQVRRISDGSLLQDECRMKGFKVNYRTEAHFTNAKMLEMVEDPVASESVNDVQFLRNIREASVRTEMVEKSFKMTADKRLRLWGYRTLPIGTVAASDDEHLQLMPRPPTKTERCLTTDEHMVDAIDATIANALAFVAPPPPPPPDDAARASLRGLSE